MGSLAKRWIEIQKEPEKSGFEKFIYALNRPGSSVRGGIKSIRTGDDLLEGLKTGWAGDVKSIDLMSPEFVKQNPKSAAGIGLVSDILTDPITYIPASVGMKALKYAGKGIKSVTKLIPGGKRAATVLAKAFKPGYQFPTLEGRFQTGRRALFEKLGETQKTYEEIAKKIPIAERAKLSTAFEKNILPEPTAFNQAVKQLDTIDQAATTRLEKADAIDTARFHERTGLRHLPHMTTKEAKKYLAKDNDVSLKQQAIRDIVDDMLETAEPKLKYRGHYKGRTFYGQELKEGTIEEMNKISMEKIGKPFFEDDVVKLVMNKEMISHRVSIAHDMLSDISKDPAFSQYIVPIEKGIIPAGFTVINHPVLAGKAVHKDLAKEIETGMRVFGLGQQNKFLKNYDKALTWWKRWTLSPFPAYHTRNFVGDTWNNYLAGILPGQSWKEASKLAIGKGKNLVIKLQDGSSMTGKEIKKLFEDNNLGMGLFWKVEQESQDVLGLAEKQANPLLRLFSPATQGKYKSPFIHLGEKAGDVRENFGRYQHLVYMLKKGLTPQEAVKSVKKYLFDYSELTQFEKRVMKRIIPFYSWTRKNVPLQIENAIKTPYKYLALTKIRDAVESQVPGGTVNQEYLPEWAKSSAVIQLGKDPQGRNRYMPTTGFLPASDLSDLTLGGVGEKIQSGLSPFIKAPIEYITNKDLYFKNEIDRLRKVDPGIKRELQLMAKVAAKSYRPSSTIMDIIKKERTPGQLFTKYGLGANIQAKFLADLKKGYRMRKAADVADLRYALRKARKEGDKKEIDGLIKRLNEVRKR